MDRPNLSVRLDSSEEMNLQNIMTAGGFYDKAAAIRFALECTKYLIEFAAQNDPTAVLVEQTYMRGKKVFVESLDHNELAQAMLFVREKIGTIKFDNMLAQARERDSCEERDSRWFDEAMAYLVTKQAPYKLAEIINALQVVSDAGKGGIGQSYALVIFKRHFHRGKLKLVGIDSYEIAGHEDPKPFPIPKEQAST